MITYKDTNEGITVYLNGIRAGLIVANSGGYKYVPRDSKISGEVFAKLNDLKKDLEEEEV